MADSHKQFFPSFKDNPVAAYGATIAIGVLLAVLPFVVGSQGNAWVRILDFALGLDHLGCLPVHFLPRGVGQVRKCPCAHLQVAQGF